MRKIVASLIITSALIQASAQELNNEKYQLIAKNVDTKENIITATGNVVIYSPTYYLSADKVIFDQEKEIFELFDNVLIIKENNVQTQSNYAYVDLKNDIFNQSPMFLYDNSNNLWSNAKKSDKNKEMVNLDGTIISSCDCIDPDWSIRTSSSDYDTEAMWINAYNPRLYFKSVPVFYLPYFGFPTDTTRRTGLLLPMIGYSKGEGFYYSQPFFIAPADNYDIELIPQIRTLRGSGIYSHFRYADSPDSMLRVKAGYFKEKPKYKEKEELDNSEHYGVDVDYSRRNILANSRTHEDGVFASLKYLNDVEYITLEDADNATTTDKKVESKFNYFYNTPDYYGGAYSRYYIDAGQPSNSKTMQELPQIQLHSYNKEFLIDGLIYSFDTKYMNYTRRSGINADVYEASLPISYSKYFLEDFLYLTLENKTILNQYNYSNSEYKYDNGTLLQNRTSFIAGTDLIRPYTDYIHTMNITAQYDIPKNISENGDLYGVTVNKIQTPTTNEQIINNQKYTELSSFPVIKDNKNINLALNQSIYDKDSLKQIINHKVSQAILYDNLDEAKFQDFENYVKINHDYGSISGKIIYNQEDNEIVESSANNTIRFSNLSFSAGYYKSKKTDNEFNNRDDLESYSLDTSYRIAKDYSIGYFENHNIQEKVKNRQGIRLNIDDSCWNLDLRLEKEITPRSRYISSQGRYDSYEQTIVYATLLLKPIGGIKQKYKVDDNSNDFR